MIAAPLYDTKGKFDTEIYSGKAVIVKTDGSVEVLNIDPDTGKVFIEVEGKKIDMLSAENPSFRDLPVIKYPEPK